MKKRIGVLTFQQSSNYGAIMQAYALNKALNNLGSDCETINYNCSAIARANYVKCMTVKDLLKNAYKAWKNYWCTQFVKNNIRLSPAYKKKSIKNSLYDAYVVGSDQIWNPHCTGDDRTYFLDFIQDKQKKYSYAASIGLKGEEALAIIKDHKKLLDDFADVSLREHIDDDRVLELVSTNVRYDIDPVFLLSRNEWKKICGKRCIKDKYIFVYLIGNPVGLEEFAQKLSKETGYKIISSKKSGDFMRHCKPEDFLSWINNAEYIVTNSFHGTALSIIYHKEFYVECTGVSGFNYRVGGLLKLLGLTDRVIEYGCSIDLDKKIEYEAVDKMVEDNRRDSMKYLKNIINS